MPASSSTRISSGCSRLFAAGVPWAPDEHDFAHAHPHGRDPRTHCQIHDELHARRRMAIAPDADVAAARSCPTARPSVGAADAAGPSLDTPTGTLG